MTEIPLLGPHALGEYQLVAEIGRGGMADVFLALTPPVNGRSNQVVIKQVRRDVLEDEDFRAMFLDEARLAQKLCHPNVVKTLDVGKDGDAYFIVMEFLDGQPLSRIRKHARKIGVEIPLAAHLRILADVLAGLHYVHELTDQDGVALGVVHRDATPPNVFVTYDGHVKVVDFGIAKARARDVETRVGVVKGKLSYLAPENVRGDHVDRRSDIFSAGVMLWEAATGRRFWQGLDELTVYQKLVSGDLPTRSAVAEMSPQLFAIVERALAPKPDDRFATAAEMKRAIDALPVSQTASRAAVSGYLYQLFVQERRDFHRRVEEEVRRLEAGDSPANLPNLRPEMPPLSVPTGNPNRLPTGSTFEPAHGAPNSAHTGPTVTSFSSPSIVTTPIATPPRVKSSLLIAVGAAALVVAGYALHQTSPGVQAKVNPVSAAMTPPALPPPAGASQPLAPTTLEGSPSIETSPPTPTATPTTTLRAPAVFARPAPKKVEEPDGFEEIHRELRRKRALDAEDPWAK